MNLNLFLNMLTPIKKQGDEHIYILLQFDIIDWMSVRYVRIHRFVRMLISSEITGNYRNLPVAELSQSRDFFFDLVLVSDCSRYQAGNQR